MRDRKILLSKIVPFTSFVICKGVDVNKQIFFKNVESRGIISLSDAEWNLVPLIFVVFGAHFLNRVK